MINTNKEIKESGIPIKFGIVTGDIVVIESDPKVDDLIERYIDTEFDSLTDPKSHQSIMGGRSLYRHFKKDPTRYRLSSEALIRRLKSGKGLYSINNIVDLMNYFSIKYGNPIGIYDLEKIKGPIEYRLGHKDEFYKGLGKGTLNIENLPVLADELGAFGSATSDTERTMITLETKKMLLIIYYFKDISSESYNENALALLNEYIKFDLNINDVVE